MSLSNKLKELELEMGGSFRFTQDDGKNCRGNDKFTTHNYGPFYEKYLPKNPKCIVELGILRGHSLKIWSTIFPEARIIGLDLFPNNAIHAPENVELYEFDELNPNIELFKSFNCDVFIDDAIHSKEIQTNTFKLLSPFVKGIYIIEDIKLKEELDFLDERDKNIGLKYL